MAENPPNNETEAQASIQRINPSRPAARPPVMSSDAPEPQDLGLTKLSGPDQNWRRMQPIQIAPSVKRLDAPHRIMTVVNDSQVVMASVMGARPQTHIVLDRYMVGHELRPGERREIDLLTSDIEYFLSRRAPDRTDMLGRPVPKHPIRFEGFDEDRYHREKAAQKREQRAARLSQEQAAGAQQWPNPHPMPPERDPRDLDLERQHDWRRANQPSREEVEKRDRERAEREHEEGRLQQRVLEGQTGFDRDRPTTHPHGLQGSLLGEDKPADRSPEGNKPEGGKSDAKSEAKSDGNKSEGNKSDKDEKSDGSKPKTKG